jgi:hypothetical protein
MQIRTRHGVAQGAQNFSNATHAGTPDSNKVDAPEGTGEVGVLI